MDKLTKDELFSIAILLDLPDLLNFCKSDERIDKLVCKKNDIWFHKLKEFSNWRDFNFNKSLQEIYTTLYGLRIVQKFIKEKANQNYSLLELYNLKELWLNNNQLREIPKELGNLVNLKTLSLHNNQLTEIPKELFKTGNLLNLKILSLYNNQIKEIPKELENKPGLRICKFDI